MRTFSFYLILFLSFTIAGCKTKALVVNTTTDTPDINPGDGQCEDANGKCSLRAAVQEVNAGKSDLRIDVRAGTYTLDSPLHVYAPLIIIRGEGPDKTVVEGNGRRDNRGFTVLHLDNDSSQRVQAISIEGLTVAKGYAPSQAGYVAHPVSNGAGGGIFVGRYAKVSLRDVTVRDNTARLQGGGIANYGRLQMVDCQVQNNENSIRSGGGIFNWGSLKMSDCAVVRNKTGVDQGDSSTPYGAGIYSRGRLTMTNCTVSENDAGPTKRDRSIYGNYGAGIHLGGSHITRLINCTIADNKGHYSDLASISVKGSTVPAQLQNCIVTSHRIENLYGPITSLGGNIMKDVSSNATFTRDPSAVAPDVVGTSANKVDPQLEPLQQVRHSWVHKLTINSPAIAAADTAACPQQDQLGQHRGRPCDCGAVEYDSSSAQNGR